MKPTLLVGLGNALSGDDGIGCLLARALRDHPRLPPDVEVLEGGSDILRLEPLLQDRDRIVILDALLDPDEAGTVLRYDWDFRDLEAHGGSVHHLSPIQALRLLAALNPRIHGPSMTFLGITIHGTSVSHELSPGLRERLPSIQEEVLEMVGTAVDYSGTSGR